jgi:hypothetical protein
MCVCDTVWFLAVEDFLRWLWIWLIMVVEDFAMWLLLLLKRWVCGGGLLMAVMLLVLWF